MKKVLLTAITTVILFAACNKNDSVCEKDQPAEIKTSNATLLGRDLTKCSCCWGWVIEIDNSIYKFAAVPVGSSVNLDNLTYPVTANVTWQRLTGNCSTRIELLDITL